MTFNVPVSLGERVYVVKGKKEYIGTEECTNCNGRGEIYIEETDKWIYCKVCNGNKKIDQYKTYYIIKNAVLYVRTYKIGINTDSTEYLLAELFDGNKYWVCDEPVSMVFASYAEALQKVKELEVN